MAGRPKRRARLNAAEWPQEITAMGELWEIDPPMFMGKPAPHHRSKDIALYRVKGDPYRVERIFVGDSPDYGKNLVAFYAAEFGEIVPDSIGEYRSRSEALSALRSGAWYRSLPSWLLGH